MNPIAIVWLVAGAFALGGFVELFFFTRPASRRYQEAVRGWECSQERCREILDDNHEVLVLLNTFKQRFPAEYDLFRTEENQRKAARS